MQRILECIERGTETEGSECIRGSLCRRGSNYSDGDPDQEARFYILNGTQCPAVLTENLFMDNREDLAFISSKEGQKAIVALHVEGIENYLKGLSSQE